MNQYYFIYCKCFSSQFISINEVSKAYAVTMFTRVKTHFSSVRNTVCNISNITTEHLGNKLSIYFNFLKKVNFLCDKSEH